MPNIDLLMTHGQLAHRCVSDNVISFELRKFCAIVEYTVQCVTKTGSCCELINNGGRSVDAEVKSKHFFFSSPHWLWQEAALSRLHCSQPAQQVIKKSDWFTRDETDRRIVPPPSKFFVTWMDMRWTCKINPTDLFHLVPPLRR